MSIEPNQIKPETPTSELTFFLKFGNYQYFLHLNRMQVEILKLAVFDAYSIN